MAESPAQPAWGTSSRVEVGASASLVARVLGSERNEALLVLGGWVCGLAGEGQQDPAVGGGLQQLSACPSHAHAPLHL